MLFLFILSRRFLPWLDSRVPKYSIQMRPQTSTSTQLCEATRIDEPIPVFRHREAMAKGNKEGIRPSDHQRAIAMAYQLVFRLLCLRALAATCVRIVLDLLDGFLGL